MCLWSSCQPLQSPLHWCLLGLRPGQADLWAERAFCGISQRADSEITCLTGEKAVMGHPKEAPEGLLRQGQELCRRLNAEGLLLQESHSCTSAQNKDFKKLLKKTQQPVGLWDPTETSPGSKHPYWCLNFFFSLLGVFLSINASSLNPPHPGVPSSSASRTCSDGQIPLLATRWSRESQGSGAVGGSPRMLRRRGARQAQEQSRCRQRGGTAVTAGARLGTAAAGEGTAGPRWCGRRGSGRNGAPSPRGCPCWEGGMGTAPTTQQSSEEQVPALPGQSKTPANTPRDS